MWDLLGPGIEPVSPALAGGFLTTAPPGKSLHSLLTCTVFEKSDVSSYLCSSIGETFSPLWPHSKFFYLWFFAVWISYACVQFWGHLSCLLFFELPGCVVWCLILIWGNCLSDIPKRNTYVMPSVVVPWILNILFHFFSLFSLCFSVLEVFIDISSCFFLSHVQPTNEPTKAYQKLSQSSFLFLISRFLFNSFLEFPSFLPIYSCMLSTLSIRGLSILIIAVLNTWSDNSNIPDISEFDSDQIVVYLTRSVVWSLYISISSNCVVCLLVCLVTFCWKLVLMSWIKECGLVSM